MLRTFGLQTITAAASQPWFSDVTTAAIPVLASGVTIPVKVGNTKIYQVGDRIDIDPSTATQDSFIVDTIPDSTTLNCRVQGGGANKAHATAAVIRLAIACAKVEIQAITTTGSMWLGADNTVTNAGAGLAVRNLGPSAIYSYSEGAGSGPDPVNTAEGWVAGTPGDTFIAVATVI